MNLRDFSYFIQLVKRGNFLQTAKDFNVSQPTITHAIKRLETQYGKQLLIRNQSHSAVTLTTAGKRLLPYAQAIVDTLDQAATALAQRPITFGLPPIIGNRYFPTLAQQLAGTSLLPQLRTIERGSDDLLKMIQQGTVSLALLGSSGALTLKNVTLLPVTTSPFMLVVSENHPLAHVTHLSLTDLQHESFLLLADGFVHSKAFSWFENQAHKTFDVTYRTSDVALIKTMIKDQVGIGFLTQLAIAPNDHLHPILIDAPDQPSFNVSIGYRQSLLMTPELTTLINLLKQLA